MKLANILDVVRDLAPEHLAEDWDKVGLHLGDPAWQVSRALLCIDLTEAVMAEAVAQRSQLIVAYHPPIFKPVTALTTATAQQRVLLGAAQRKIAIYSPHTALDAAADGVNDFLASLAGPGEVVPIRPTGGATQYKIITFVPAENADRVRDAMARVGAGVIGDYTQCSFTVSGEGTFKGGAGANPAVGKKGRLERVPELRLEMVCPDARLGRVVAALREAHPYEEPAMDVFRLESLPTARQSRTGQGRIVRLERPISVRTLAGRVKKGLGLKHLEVAAPRGLKQVQTVGVCAGAGASLLPDAGDVDVFITGEMRHHDVLAASARGVGVMLAGHTQTERPYLKVYRRRLRAKIGTAVAWTLSRADRAPGDWM